MIRVGRAIRGRQVALGNVTYRVCSGHHQQSRGHALLLLLVSGVHLPAINGVAIDLHDGRTTVVVWRSVD